jgi:hypothetical protein
MRNPGLKALFPLALICAGVEAVPMSADGTFTPQTALTPRQAGGQCPGQDGPGVLITNKGNATQTFAFFKNLKNGDAWAAPEFNNPDPDVPNLTVQPGDTGFAKTPYDWKGRAQRGTLQPATWAEFQVQATGTGGDGKAHGDISLIQGCDGAVTVASTDGNGANNGFTISCLTGAPPAALEKKSDGSQTIGRLVQNWPGSDKNPAAVPWLASIVQSTQAYMLGPDGNASTSGVPDVASGNNCLQFNFY